ncbi:MAG: type I restriction enzyme HsdR N-terminal domain-containing protein [Bacteroidota bacterium]
MLQLDLLQHRDNLQLKTESSRKYIFDPIRKKYLVLQPEEFVRQLILQHFLQIQSYNANRISVERSLRVNTLLKRCDILIYDLKMNPWLLVECKAPEVAISQATFDQIARYNMPLRVSYLMVSNGLQSFICEMNYETESWKFLQELPSYPG